jgi:GAF domain-containing protein
VLTGTPFVNPDLSADRQFKAMHYVTGQPGFRFYAGVPSKSDLGKTVGALCLRDTRPRTFSSLDVKRLERFGVVASGHFKLQRANVLVKQGEAYLRLPP